MYKLFILSYFIFSFQFIFSQKIEEICGEYTYIIPENVTLEQAKRIAIERAKIEALANKYGTIVSQVNTSHVQTDNEKSNISFSSLGGTEVKGEWLEDTKEPIVSRKFENDLDRITAKVCGKAREITSVRIDFLSKILNKPDAKLETDIFIDRESFFLSFRSPVDGYLSVYLFDNKETCYCLLPYMNDKTGKVQIKGGKDYLFFSKEHVPAIGRSEVDEYELRCNESIENNYFYIIFSPNEFTKANDSRAKDEKELPREIPFKDFRKWLYDSRTRDEKMEVRIKPVTIIQIQ